MIVKTCYSFGEKCPCIQCAINGVKCEFEERMHETRDTKYLCDRARAYCENANKGVASDEL